jgi:DNA polymerase I-like protein with 3'-5' exonuclease and polymerase domains
MNETRIFLDLETECAVGCTVKCDHALDFNRNRISVVGITVEDGSGRELLTLATRSLQDVVDVLDDFPGTIVGHNLVSFDLKVLKAKGIDLTDREVEDTQLMLLAYTEKVPESWLEGYEAERKRINREEKKHHREVGRYSLKTAAPYFLGVDPFWETDNKDDDDYVLTDVGHTRALYHFLKPRLKDEGTWEFYRNRLIPWAWMLHSAEMEGVCLDLGKVEELSKKAEIEAGQAKEELDAIWQDAYETYLDSSKAQVRNEYAQKLDGALLRLKPATLKDPVKAAARTQEKVQRTRSRYQGLLAHALSKVEPFNLNSDDQMLWLLKDYRGYDVRTLDAIQKGFEKDCKQTHYWNEYKKKQEPIFSSGSEVLERLSAEGKKDAEVLLRYRAAEKLSSAFFPSYREMQFKGKLHCNFNICGTRTGRLSSNSPNLQQVPGDLKQIFSSRPGYSLITRDMGAIEPVLIAYFSQDPTLCGLLIEGENFHNDCTPIFFEGIEAPPSQIKKLFPKERDCTKQCDLSILYGSRHNMLRRTYLKHGFHFSLKYCKAVLNRFRDRYEGVFEFKEQILDRALASGEVITNLCGRKFRLDPDQVAMKSLNTLIQSSASDLVLLSGQKINQEFQARGIKGGVRLFVHDEIVVEAEDSRLKEAEEIVERCMTNYKLPTPYGNLPLAVEGKTAKYWAK